MADLTYDAVSKVLGALSKAISDEAALLGGLPGNMQFIKDELDSMNGFLLHLTKTEREHDDQVRAWMKQVREVAYIAEDCVDRYVRDVVPHEPHWCCRLPYVADMTFFVCSPQKFWLRHRLAKQITELKARVNDVGQRRQRYGVTVPPGSDLTLAVQKKDADEERKREGFRRLLLLPAAVPSPSSSLLARITAAARQVLPAGGTTVAALPPFVSEAIGHLPVHVRPQGATVVRGTWEQLFSPAAAAAGEDDDETTLRPVMEMLLCALYVYPYKANNLELERLERKLDPQEGGARPEDIKKQVMVFCYSLLSTSQKSCLQYLTAFLEETAISRTSLVRRWVAEGLVNKEQARTPEEVGERHFSDLVFRGFIHPARIGDAGTVKSCKPLAGSIRAFITDIAGSENFVTAELPVHLDRQLKIRQIVRRTRPLLHQAAASDRRCWACGLICCTRTCRRSKSTGEPMDDLVTFLKELPEMYRLNVLDLGGCRGIKDDHISAICTVTCLKYLCLRNTDVSRLDPTDLERGLAMLETLDIRQTSIRPGDVKRIFLPKLKHLLAGRYLTESGADAGTARASAEVLRLATVDMPDKIGKMTNMETLSHVQISSDDGKELARVARLEHLRKLGVVVHGNDRTAAQLREVIYALAGCLRSLSVWVTKEGGALDISILNKEGLILENLDIDGRCSLPSWIESAKKLANVSLRDTELSGGETLRRLGSVPSLSCLRLGRRSFVGQVLSFKDVRFQALRFLIVDCDTTSRVAFEAGAAAKLEKIVCNIGSRVRGGGELIVGIQHLPNLKVIEIRGNFNLAKLMELKQVSTATNNPRYHCRYLDSPGEKQFVEVPKTATDTTFSLPIGVVVNQQN